MSVATRDAKAGASAVAVQDVAAPASAAPAGAAPLASVVVPTHARPERLARLLDSLARQTPPGGTFEIVVVDDGSPAHARPEVPASMPNARLVRQAQAGPAAARNRGADEARAPLLLFVDDDCTVEPGWVRAFVEAHRDAPDALLGGATANGLAENPWSDAAEGLLGFLDAEALAGGGALDFVASNNIACSRARFVAVGGFDARYPLAAGEDRAFCRAWTDAGGTIERVTGARATHFHALDGRRFWRQQHNYGRGAARFHADRPDVGALPRPPGFYARLLLHPLGRRDRSLARRLATLVRVALSQLAVTSGLLVERRALRREPGRAGPAHRSRRGTAGRSRDRS